MSEPDHWIRATDAALDRPTIVFDLDGVIADASHRQRFLRDGRREWDAFFAASADDEVIVAGAALAAAIADDHTVVILTARPDSIRRSTIEWLADNRIRHDLLIIRPPHDPRSSAGFKHAELEALVAQGCDVRSVLEDGPSNIEMMNEAGYPTIPVDSGYYRS